MSGETPTDKPNPEWVEAPYEVVEWHPGHKPRRLRWALGADPRVEPPVLIEEIDTEE